jgi:hypothetical protein
MLSAQFGLVARHDAAKQFPKSTTAEKPTGIPTTGRNPNDERRGDAAQKPYCTEKSICAKKSIRRW